MLASLISFDPQTDEWPPIPSDSVCDPTDLCCNVNCGNYGTCDPSTGSCSHCSGKAYTWGDPHHHSFDGRITDFQGKCSYKLSGTCLETENGKTSGKIDAETPYFRLIGRQMGRNDADTTNPWFWMSFLYGWTMEWQPEGTDGISNLITLSWDFRWYHIVRIIDENGEYTDSRFGTKFNTIKGQHYYPEWKIQTVGELSKTIYFGIDSEEEAKDPDNHFKIKIIFHRNSLTLHLDCAYKNNVCGLFGNFDGDRDNDWTKSDGTIMNKPVGYNLPGNAPLWTATEEFGNSWIVDNDHIVPDSVACDVNVGQAPSFSCDAATVELISSDTWCGKLQTSPFNACEDNADETIHACIYDFCMLDPNDWAETLCDYLEDHVEKCNDQNIGSTTISSDWRSDGDVSCPAQCEAGTDMEYISTADPLQCMLTSDNCHLELSEISDTCLYQDPQGLCYKDSLTDRELTDIEPLIIPSGLSDSITWCRSACALTGYLYAGIQYQKYCYCGNNYGKHGLSDSQTECDTNCEDIDGNIGCGGQSVHNVYLANHAAYIPESRCACPVSKPIWDNDKNQCISSCPATEIRKTYHFYVEEGDFNDFGQAAEFCQNKGMQLPTFYSSEEFSQFQAGYSSLPNHNTAQNTGVFWIGAKYDVNFAGTHPNGYYWVDSTGHIDLTYNIGTSPSEFIAWDDGEPNPTETSNEDCGIVYENFWYDVHCSNAGWGYQAACEERSVIRSTLRCYHFYPTEDAHSFNDAVNFCKSLNMTLPTFNSQNQWDEFMTQYSTIPDHNTGAYWLGAIQDSTNINNPSNHQEGFYWTNQDGLVDSNSLSLTSTFQLWGNGQPDNGSSNENCVLYYGSGVDLWYDVDCSNVGWGYQVVCQEENSDGFCPS